MNSGEELTGVGSTESRVPILLDCDTGIDDALAILYLALCGRIDLIAAGSVHGNVPSRLGAQNTRRVLELVGLGDVPVAVGAARPMAQPLQTAEWVHGQDGLGNTGMPPPKVGPTGESAVEQMVRLVRERPRELTLLAVGPLTNLGAALLVEPSLPSLVKRVVIMGGTAVAPGNVSAVAEANIWHDPEAAALVFGAAWPLTMVGLDVTMEVLLERDQLRQIEAAPGPVPRFAWSILQHYLRVYEQFLGRRTCPLHDPLAAVLAVAPSLARYHQLPVHIELQGDTRGMTVCDRRPRNLDSSGSDSPLTAVALEVDADAAREAFLSTILAPDS